MLRCIASKLNPTLKLVLFLFFVLCCWFFLHCLGIFSCNNASGHWGKLKTRLRRYIMLHALTLSSTRVVRA